MSARTTSAVRPAAAATSAPVSLVKAPWMRAVVLNQATAAGWKHTQVSTSTDQFTKGTQVIEISWGSVVTRASHQEGKNSPKVLDMGHANKLQHITNWIGFKTMSPTSKWTPGHLVNAKGEKTGMAELKLQAESAFRVIEPKA